MPAGVSMNNCDKVMQSAFQQMAPPFIGMVSIGKMMLRILNKLRSGAATGDFSGMHPAVAPDERIYAIGDVHGRYDLLMRLLHTICDDAQTRLDRRKVRVILLGDYIDRGDDSAKVIEALARISARTSGCLTCLRGNHEAALLDFIKDPVGGRAWLNYGADQTLESYGVPVPGEAADPDTLVRTRDALAQALGSHLDFIAAMPVFTRSGSVLFTHAGLDPEDAPRLSNTRAMLWGHPRSLTPQPVAGMRIVHGHYDQSHPILLPGRICTDTGAYYSNVLTAVRLDQGECILDTRSAQLPRNI
jgi:serine/threonine protein phosphatase 1